MPKLKRKIKLSSGMLETFMFDVTMDIIWVFYQKNSLLRKLMVAFTERYSAKSVHATKTLSEVVNYGG